MRSLVAALLAAFLLPVGGAGGTPLACTDPCEIEADWYGYLPPAVELASSTVVQWIGIDDSHPTADSSDGGTRCFSVRAGYRVEPTPVRFDVVDDALFATTDPGTPEEITVECTGATVVGSLGWRLPFRCLLHPWMNGELIVSR